MTDDLNTDMAPISERTRARLQDIRRGLLRVHKALLEAERVAFERARGRVESSGEFLQLVLRDPWFAWLRPLSEMIVQIDETMAAEEPATEVAGGDLLKQARMLLRPSAAGDLFEKKYYDALQRDPDVVLAHAAVSKQLAAEP